MRVSTVIMLIASVVCAGLAAVLAKFWLESQNLESKKVAQQEIIHKTLPADMGTVVVAAQPLGFGSKLTTKNLREISWPVKALPKGSFRNIKSLMKGGSRTVLSAIAANEPIIKQKITAPGQRASLSTLIDTDSKAVTIRVNDVHGVAGFVQPDDRVDVMITRAKSSDDPKKSEESAFADVLLQNIRVLAIDQLADRRNKIRPAKVVTLEVNTIQAQKLILGSRVGQLSLALRPAGFSARETTRRVNIQDIVGGSKITPVSTSSTGISGPVVGVTRALKRKEYSVPSDLISRLRSHLETSKKNQGKSVSK